MSAIEEIRRLESELEIEKQIFREDAAQIRHKIEETKAKLNPTNLVRERIYLAVGGALLTGFAVGYFP
jgi:hypothetical protein